MPSLPYTASELYEAALMYEMAMAIDDDEGSDDDMVEGLLYSATDAAATSARPRRASVSWSFEVCYAAGGTPP